MVNKRGRTVWYSFWDTCIQDDRGFWTRFNYIHNNPVKHGCFRLPRNWPFSSYGEYAEEKGQAWLTNLFQQYPVRHYLDEGKVYLLSGERARSTSSR